MNPLSKRIFLLILATFTLSAQNGIKLPFGTWRRLSQHASIEPRGTGWESAGTFNPAVALHDDKVVMLYRAQDKSGISRLGYAESDDGIHFSRRPEPVLSP